MRPGYIKHITEAPIKPKNTIAKHIITFHLCADISTEFFKTGLFLGLDTLYKQASRFEYPAMPIPKSKQNKNFMLSPHHAALE